MIGVQEAQALIQRHCRPLSPEEATLPEALGRVSARDVVSPCPLPLFDNSAMDGFLLCSADTVLATQERPAVFAVTGNLRAGEEFFPALGDMQAARIMTGAPLAAGGDAVIPKEKAVLKKGRLIVSAPVPRGTNVRRRGEELGKGAAALPKGSVINPGTIGFLASMGVDRVHVHRLPKVSVISTGSELVPPGGDLCPGRIFDSNLPMVRAALESMGVHPVLMRRLPDERRVLEKVASFALKESDVVILMGGVSVGEYDFVKDVLKAQRVRPVFWKVSQKPGKPLYFGKKGPRLVFGLPGNPASVFTCFYEYVYPAIRRLMGHSRPHLRSLKLKPEEPVRPDPDKTTFLKSRIVDHGSDAVRFLKGQKSHMLSSLCEADGFAVLPPGAPEPGGMVSVHALPYAD